jgi:hypothetical protein
VGKINDSVRLRPRSGAPRRREDRGEKCRLVITSLTACRVAGDTSPLWFNTRDTVATETPAARATSLIVGGDVTFAPRLRHFAALMSR